jgi:hypothetical protein
MAVSTWVKRSNFPTLGGARGSCDEVKSVVGLFALKRRTAIFVLLTAALIEASTSCVPSRPAKHDFVVTGTVSAGPTCPVERIPPDPNCADRPVSGAEIIFVNDGGNSVGSVSSDADGRFSISLPPGRYTLNPQPLPGLLGAAPTQTIVVSNADVAVKLRYDTGIR